MAIEEHVHIGVKVAHQRDASGELIDEKDVGLQGAELAGEVDGQEEVDMAENREQDLEAAEYGGWEEVATDADVERAW